MKIDVDKKVVHETNEIWGYDVMTDMAMEELAEAIQAVNKVKRFKNDPAKYEKLNDEIADVIIIIDQLEDLGMISEKTIQEYVEYKQLRQKARNREYRAMKNNK